MSKLAITGVVSIDKQGVFLNGKPMLLFSDEARDKKLEQVYRSLDVSYPKFFKMDAQSKLGWLCAEYIIKNTQSDQVLKNEVALVLSNNKASLDTDENYHHDLEQQQEEFLPSPAVFVYTLPNIVAGEICIRHGLKGENNFLISKEFDAEQLVNYTEALFAEQLCKLAYVGWVEAYQENIKALLVAVEQIDKSSNEALFNTINFNQLYQTLVL